MADDTILVNDGTIIGQLGTAARYILTTVTTYAIAKGWITTEIAQALASILGIIAPIAYGVWLSRHNKQKLLVTAAASPNDVARVV